MQLTYVSRVAGHQCPVSRNMPSDATIRVYRSMLRYSHSQSPLGRIASAIKPSPRQLRTIRKDLCRLPIDHRLNPAYRGQPYRQARPYETFPGVAAYGITYAQVFAGV